VGSQLLVSQLVLSCIELVTYKGLCIPSCLLHSGCATRILFSSLTSSLLPKLYTHVKILNLLVLIIYSYVRTSKYEAPYCKDFFILNNSLSQFSSHHPVFRNHQSTHLGHEVLTAVVNESFIFWYITLCIPLKVNVCFEGISLFLLRVDK
jgi:hypothetical protein